MVFFNESYAEITYNEATHIVTTTIKSFMTSEQLREVFTKSNECAAKFRSTKSISDNRKFVTMKPEDQKFVNESVMPMAVRAGIKKIAIILPENMIQKQVIEKTTGENKTAVEVRTFGSINEATAWLR